MSQLDLKDVLNICKRAANASGNLTRNAKPEEKINIGTYDDMVTILDLEADKLARETILKVFPDANVLSEETCKGNPDYIPSELHNFTGFLIDPIDGSVNFSRSISPNYGNFAVSIGYCENGLPLVGVIHKPLEDEMFHAIRGMGAFQDDRPIRVSEVDTLDKACVEVGSFWIREEMELFQRWFTNVETDVNQILIRGSAAAALADVARGRVEAMLHSRLNAWDYAAGWVIIEESGGVVMDGNTESLSLGSRFIYATNKNLNNVISKIIRGE